ncbi:hypothetical protein GCM10023331_39510 [Algivirga pacifica]|uniref:Uncharacterized protein n=1 Tax=Algivirga pacifica TaxID=1162670 RepID=A0ABP9DP07_9BACT
MEVLQLKAALQQLANNLSVTTLEVLADKSNKPGVEKKIQMFKHLV